MTRQRAHHLRAARTGSVCAWLRAGTRLVPWLMLAAWLLAGPPGARTLEAAQPPASRANSAPGFFWHPEIAPNGPLVMVVSLDEQYLYVYRNGVAIGASPISSGRPGYETPTGIYTILQKQREHYSNLYDNAPMPYMQRLTWDGIAIHGGTLPGHPASRGCIRLPQAFAEKLFAASQHGAVVVIADARVAPATIAHPAAVAPIDLRGQPMATPLPDDQALAALAAGGAPLSVVVSTHDRAVYALRDGQLIARSPLVVAAGDVFRGTALYVLRRGNAGTGGAERAAPSGHLWSAYRITGSGAVPEPAQLATQLIVPADFGQRLQALLVPGTTMLVTDLPGHGGTGQPAYGALLQSDQQPVGRR